MVIDLEAFRSQIFDCLGTTVDIERLFAGAAQEMVMVRPSRQLVAHATPGEFHFSEPTLLSQDLDVSVHRGQPERGRVRLSACENVVWRQRARNVEEDGTDGPSLPGVSSGVRRVSFVVSFVGGEAPRNHPGR